MTDWTSGYVADIGYTFGYYGELNPLRAKFAFLSSGLAFPDVKHACELGFGQGISVNMHAAASSVRWYGTDFNPSQASFAQELAAASGADCFLSDQAFAEFCDRTDLPEFDYIGLHGIWSWISDENRQKIVDFIGRRLRVGGVLYISYNTLPGWAQMVPLRHLLTEHAEVMAAQGRGIVSRIDAALEFADKLFALKPLFSRANPPVLEKLKQMRGQNRHYLAHEYFNRDWEPMHFADMCKWMEPAKISYACSANLLDHVKALNLLPEQATFLSDIPDQNFRETVRDFMVNQQFRRDYWVKGAKRLSVIEQMEQINEMNLILLTPVNEVTLKMQGPLGEVSMNEEVYRPLLKELADHKPVSMQRLLKDSNKKGIASAQVLQAIMILAGKGDIHIAGNSIDIQKAQTFAHKLNKALMHKARGSGDVGYLVSPVTGGAVPVSRAEQLFLLSSSNGKKSTDEWAKDVWESMSVLGQRLLKDGKPIESAEGNLSELKAQAEKFVASKLTILQTLQVI